MTTTTHSTTVKFAITFTALALGIGVVSSAPQLNSVSFDPGFISAGDRVNISANLQETDYPDRTWDEDKTLKAVLKADNRLAREYVTIEDDRDESIGFLYPNGVWNQRYQIKVDSGAPQGEYDFEIHLQYLEDGEPIEIPTGSGSQYTIIKEFSMPVDREGVDISGNVVETDPKTPRPGDSYTDMKIDFTNTGNKPIEEIDLRPETPKLIETAYSEDEKFFIDRLNEGEKSSRTLSLDLDDDLEPGLHWITFKAEYEDESSNTYTEELEMPLRVEGRPDLEVIDQKVEMKAGETSELRFNISNTGDQDAESVTARVLAERSQPFTLNDRSDYIGEVEASETAESVLSISSDRTADLKSHQIKIQLRANGDSEEGDNSVYTFTENVEVVLEERTESFLIYIGLGGALIALILLVYRYRKRKNAEQEKQDEEVQGGEE